MQDPNEGAALSTSDGPPAEHRPKPERNWLEISATVLLGVAAVLIAWSSYQSQLWNGIQDTRNTESALAIVDATDDLGRADSDRSLDQLLFVDWITNNDPDESQLLFDQMSPDGQIASLEWLDNNELRPFDTDEYLDAVYGDGMANYEGAFEIFESAADANENGDDFTLAATIIALVLFLAGVSLVLKGRTTRLLLVAGSGLITVIVLVYLTGLPSAP